MRVFINAYEIGQGYGGPEEGGWWYEYGTPLASVPFNLDDKYFTKKECYCKSLSHEEYYHEFRDGNCDECNGKRYTLEHCPWGDIPELIQKKEELQKEFAEEYEGNKRSRDQPELLVLIEFHVAKSWPEKTPHYE